MGLSAILEKAKTQLQPVLIIKAVWPILTGIGSFIIGSVYWKTLQKQFVFVWNTWPTWFPMAAVFIFLISLLILYYKRSLHKDMEFVLEKIEVSMMILTIKEFEYKSKKHIRALKPSKIRIPYLMGWTGTDKINSVRISDYSKKSGIDSADIFGPSRIGSKKNTWMFLTELKGQFQKNDRLYVEVATNAGDSNGDVEDFIGSRIPAYGIKKISLRLNVKNQADKPDQVLLCVRDETGMERVLSDHAEWHSGHEGLEYVEFEKHDPIPSWQYLLRWFYRDDPRHGTTVAKKVEIKPEKPLPDINLALKKAGGASIRRAL